MPQQVIMEPRDINDKVKLTEWKKEPSVTDLHKDLKDAIRAHKTHTEEVEKWLDNLNVTGSAERTKQKHRSSVVPKLIRKHAEWRYSSLCEPFLSTDDLFETSPQTFEDKEISIQAGQLLNYQFNTKIKKVAFIDEYVRTAVDEGTVIVRVGWKYQDEVVTEQVPVTELVPIQDPLRAQQMLNQSKQPMDEIVIGSRWEERVNIIANYPTIEVCNYTDIIPDPTCEGDLDKANFIIYRFQTSLAQLKKEGIYMNLDQIDPNYIDSFADNEITVEPKDENEFKFADKTRKKFMAYEYWGFWDIDGDGILKPIVVTFAGNAIIRMENNPFPDNKVPFVFVQYLPTRKSLYGEPDGKLLEDNQNIIGAVTRGIIDILGRSANGQTGVAKGALDVVNKRKFDKGEDYEYNPGVNPEKIFFTHTFPQIPQSAEYILTMQSNEAESLTGVKAFQGGISGKALGSTATAVRSALDATSKRELGILRRLAEGIIEIGRKVMAMNAEFLSEEEVVRVTNEQFVTIRRDDLNGHYDIRLTISTAETDDQKAQELAFMLQTIGNNLDFSLVQMLLADIAKLRKMPTLAKRIEEYQPQPDPMAQRKAELEIGLLEAQVMNEQAKAQENATDVELKRAKTRTEMAKGRHLDSQSDLKDLDFIKTDSGAKQQEELQRKDQEYQHKMNIQTAKSMLDLNKPKANNTKS